MGSRGKGHGAAHQWDAVGEESQANPYEED